MLDKISWDQPNRIEVVSGAFCMLRRKALDRVGLLDEDFFMYGEDKNTFVDAAIVTVIAAVNATAATFFAFILFPPYK